MTQSIESIITERIELLEHDTFNKWSISSELPYYAVSSMVDRLCDDGFIVKLDNRLYRRNYE